MFIIVLGQHVSILIESSSDPSKKIQGGSNMTGTDVCVNKPHQSRSYLNHLVYPYLKCLKMRNEIESSILIEIEGFSLTSYKINVCHPEVFNTYINIH